MQTYNKSIKSEYLQLIFKIIHTTYKKSIKTYNPLQEIYNPSLQVVYPPPHYPSPPHPPPHHRQVLLKFCLLACVGAGQPSEEMIEQCRETRYASFRKTIKYFSYLQSWSMVTWSDQSSSWSKWVKRKNFSCSRHYQVHSEF